MGFSISTSHLLLGILGVAAPALTDVTGIAIRDMYEEIEHIMVDSRGYNSDGLTNAINPCSNFIRGTGTEGEQSSAEWVRLVFHDAITADISEGTGGIDASIGFEKDRAENAGLHFIDDSLNFFGPDVNAYASMADLMAVAFVQSIAECNGTTTALDLRAGRVDATEAGPSGVPEPTTDIDTTLATFASAGFDQAEAITLTACGHSLGSIHYANFPSIVDDSVVTVNNTDGGDPFDTTPGVFDANVVNEYLEVTGNFGGALAAGANVSARSDFRLYNSDSNSTMQSIADETSFQTACNTVFKKLLNVVPSNVTLSDVITPMEYKVIDLGLDIDDNGAITLSGQIRYLYSSGSAASSVSYTYTTNGVNSSEISSSAASETGTSNYGSTSYYDFSTTLDSPGTTELTIEGAVSYPINDEIFVVPASSTIDQRGGSITVVAAALTSLDADNITAYLYVPTTQTGSVSKQIVINTFDLTATGTAGNYTLYSGDGTFTSSGGGSIIVKVEQGDAVSSTIKGDLFSG